MVVWSGGDLMFVALSILSLLLFFERGTRNRRSMVSTIASYWHRPRPCYNKSTKRGREGKGDDIGIDIS